jgi:hypothetical protein
MTATDRTDPFTTLVSAIPAANPRTLATGFRTGARLGERLSRVALNAADDAAGVSGDWTRTTLADLEVAMRSRDKPVDYVAAVGAYAAATVEVAAEKFASFAEIARRVQMETIEVLLAAHADTPAGQPKAAAPAPAVEPAAKPAPKPRAARPAASGDGGDGAKPARKPRAARAAAGTAAAKPRPTPAAGSGNDAS